MNELKDHPALLIGGVVVLVVAAVLLTQHSGPTSSTTSTTSTGRSAADLKVLADAEATTQASLTADKTASYSFLSTYAKQRQDYDTGLVNLRTTAATTAMQTSAAVQLGQAQIASSDKQAQIQASTAQHSSDNNLVGGIFGGIFSFIGGLFGL